MSFRMSLLSVVLVGALAMLGGCEGKPEKETPPANDPAPAAAPETTGSGVPAAISAKFTEGSCCDKAEKAGEACGHPCCKEAVAAGKACEKCNKA